EPNRSGYVFGCRIAADGRRVVSQLHPRAAGDECGSDGCAEVRVRIEDRESRRRWGSSILNPQSSILNPRSSMLDARSSILDLPFSFLGKSSYKAEHQLRRAY